MVFKIAYVHMKSTVVLNVNQIILDFFENDAGPAEQQHVGAAADVAASAACAIAACAFAVAAARMARDSDAFWQLRR